MAETSTAVEVRERPVGGRAANYQTAVVLAGVLSGLLTLISLIVPPTLSHDAAWGMQEWRSYTTGAPINTVTHPAMEDIAHDQVSLVTWWSPGQYLVPGALTRLGLGLGASLSIIAGISLLSCLLGWIQLAKHFALTPKTTALMLAFIGTFRYSTLPFGVYNGGEILLQGLTPWLILTACSIPAMSAIPAALLACLAILGAFFAKLTGVMVISVAFFACGVESLVRLRRVTAGMIAGAIGAVGGLAVLYVVWFSRGSTPASGTGFSLRIGDVLFAWAAPWGAGISWTDMFTSLLINLRHPAVSGGEGDGGSLSLMLCLLVVPTLIFAMILLQGWKRRDDKDSENLARLLKITVLFYGVYALAMSAIFLRGGDVSVEERHLRAAGMLIFMCTLATASHFPKWSASRLSAGVLCCLMSLYGSFAFAYRAYSTKRAQVDSYSGTYQPNIDPSAIGFLREAFAREGTAAVFVLPSPEAACAFSPRARILTNHIDFEDEKTISSRTYRGKIQGSLYVVVPDRIAQSDKQRLLLGEFVDYSIDRWEKRSFGSTTVLIQQALN